MTDKTGCLPGDTSKIGSVEVDVSTAPCDVRGLVLTWEPVTEPGRHDADREEERHEHAAVHLPARGPGALPGELQRQRRRPELQPPRLVLHQSLTASSLLMITPAVF